MPWLGEISLGKEFERVSETLMTPEEKAELEKAQQEAQGGGSSAAAQPTTLNVAPDVPSTGAASASQPAPGAGQPSALADGSSPGTDLHKPDGAQSPAHKSAAKGGKLTAEQKKQLEALDDLKQKERAERIDMLIKELLSRVRPFVSASHPGDPQDPETQAFEKRIKLEAEDLKVRS